MKQTLEQAPPCRLGEAQLRLTFEKAGWRYTRQRAAVYDYLCSAASHPTAEEVYAAVRRRVLNISLATVYKALEALVDCHLAGKLSYSDGPARYDCRSDAHYHLHCLRTDQVRDLPTPFDPNLLDKLDPHLVEGLRREGFKVTGYRLELLGHFERGEAFPAGS
jgi:Fe2+ or Zn2+ uptake regulation protein